MGPNDTGPRQIIESSTSAQATPKTKTRSEGDDWNKENAAFVAAYNALIEAEGVALEEYRLF
jgi:post-segregation antitoxin (ccd killing protein)